MKLKYNEKQCGIYAIINIINDKIYIGKSINLYSRKYQHFSQLNSGRHNNCHLQASVIKYGPKNFYFNVIEFCNKDILGEREHYWICHFNANNRDLGYNIDIINGDGSTTRDWSSISRQVNTNKKIVRTPKFGTDNPTSKHVYQYSLDGEFITHFGGCHEASRILNSPESFTTISKICRNKKGSSLGYQWRYEKYDNITPYENKTLETNKRNAKSQRKPIIAINLETEEETIYNSILEASKLLDLDLSSIARIANGQRKKSKKLNITFKYLDN